MDFLFNNMNNSYLKLSGIQAVIKMKFVTICMKIDFCIIQFYLYKLIKVCVIAIISSIS
jgi:hypothetical protein